MNCEKGEHAEVLIAQPPYDGGTYVNVDWVCPACGLVVASDSWTKEGWVNEQKKLARKQPRG